MNRVRWIVSLAVLCTAPLHAQQSQPDRPTASSQPDQARKPRRLLERDLQVLIEKEKPSLEARSHRISEELSAMDRAALKDDDWAKEWAGTYYTGDGLGMNIHIMLAPKSGLTYTWHGCLGLYDANHGDIVAAFPGGIKVKLAIDPEASQYQVMSETVYFVRWGDRRYIVPESLMLDLVNAYNEGGYARSSLFAIPRKFEKDVRHHEYLEPIPPGRPELPKQYARLILHPPLQLTVTRVATEPLQHLTGDVFVSKSALGFDRGSDDGIFAGMEVRYENGGTSGIVKIDWVAHNTCSGTLMLFVSKTEKFVPPPVGFTLLLPGVSTNATTQSAEPSSTRPETGPNAGGGN